MVDLHVLTSLDELVFIFKLAEVPGVARDQM
jgi:hypothetical protein